MAQRGAKESGVRAASALLALAVALTSSIAGSSVDVAYAGSLVTPMESTIGAAFMRSCSCTYHGEGKGSVALTNLIVSGLRNPDVFISADPRLLEGLLSAKAHPPLISWYARFGRARMVLGYSPRSHFAPYFARAARGELSIAAVLKTRGLRIGRTDPKLDPKGYRSVLVMRRLSRHFHDAALSMLLESPKAAGQVFPEEDLLVRLESGDLDVAFLYSTESESRHIPALEFPLDSNVGVDYAITVLDHAPNKLGAAAFVRFILKGPGRSALQQAGLSLFKPVIRGDARAAATTFTYN